MRRLEILNIVIIPCYARISLLHMKKRDALGVYM